MSLLHCLAKVASTPHLVAVHAKHSPSVYVVQQLGWDNRSKKMAQLFHFLNQGLGTYAEKARRLDLSSLAEFMAGNSKEAMNGEVAAGIDTINMRLPLGCVSLSHEMALLIDAVCP